MGYRFLAVLLLLTSLSFAAEPCAVKFTIVQKDDLNNVKQGINSDTLAWLSKKMSKKYPDVCYETPSENVTLVFFISAVPATYHGYRTVTHTHDVPTTGTVTDSDGNMSTINGTTTETSTSTVPEAVDYDKLILSIEKIGPDKKVIALHNFAGKTLHPTMYGLCTGNCHPAHKLIESAMKWIHEGGLNDPLQTVLVPDQGQK